MGLTSSRRLQVTLFAIPLCFSLRTSLAQAQTCPYATLRLDSSQTIDSSNICQAAKPWSDQGYQVLVYLTDEQPDTEDDWYALLDQIEADAGLRDLSLPDSFKKNGLALATQTAAPKYEVSVTYGETLYNTPIDTSSKFEEIKQNIRVKLGRGNAEEALIYGLQDMYALNHAAEDMPAANNVESSPVLPQPVAQVPVSSSPVYQQPAADPWAGVRKGAGLLTTAGLGIGLWQHRRQQTLKQQRQQLQERIAALLIACNELLTGNSSTDTILYDLFEAARGRLYPELENQVINWLTQARQALDQAFILQDELQQQQPKWLHSKHVQNWEELYLALIGSKLYREKLTDEELRIALDPMQTLATYRWENQLAATLQKIQQQLAGASLSIELITIEATDLEAKSSGILGTLQQVKEQIARLRKSETEAPRALAAMRTYSQDITTEFPTDLNISAEQALQGIDRFLNDADIAMQKKRFLDTLERCELAQKGLDWLQEYGDEIATYRQHQADIQTILNAGFRPPQQAKHQSALAICIETGQQTIAAGDYSTIPAHLAELKRLDEAALYHTQQWQQLCHDNRQQIEVLNDEYAQLQADCDGPAVKTWDTLQTYPAENWQMVETCLPIARQTLATVHQ